jgi:hypothetical protein
MNSSRIKVGTDPVETNESNSTGADDFSNQSNEPIKVARKPVERMARCTGGRNGGVEDFGDSGDSIRLDGVSSPLGDPGASLCVALILADSQGVGKSVA